MITQRDLEARLHADAQELDRDFPGADKLELRILARVAVTPRVERGGPTLKQELALAGLFAIVVALLAIGIGRLKSLSQPAPAKPTPTVQSSRAPGTASSFPPGAVKMVTATVGWASNIYSADIYRTTDVGVSWQHVSPPPIPNQNGKKVAVGVPTDYFLDSGHAWAARVVQSPACCSPTAGLVIYRTTDGGQTWTAGETLPARGFYVKAQLGFLDAEQGWLFVEVQANAQPGTPVGEALPELHFVGGTNAPAPENTNYDRGLTRTIYTTDDGGQHWSRLVSAPQSGGSVLGTTAVGCEANGLIFNSLDTGWLTFECSQTSGSGPSGPVSSTALATLDGGRTWATLRLDKPTYCDFTPPVFTHTVGAFVLSRPEQATATSCGIYVTGDGGRTWTFHPLPRSAALASFSDGQGGWAISSNGDVYQTASSGRSWIRTGSLPIPPRQYLTEVQVLDNKVGFAATRLLMGDFTYFETTDGGRTWVVVPPPPT